MRRSQNELLYSSSTTYEASRAKEWNASQADKIHWERDAAYRNQAYRHLHHQDGLIGKFQVRLLEASDLQRSHWSALALGPVKLLGLSKAHGAVSSFVSFSLGAESRDSEWEQEKVEDSKPVAKGPATKRFRSPVISQNSNPVWTNCQFDIPLEKGMFQDGQPILLKLRVDEDSTAVENLIPNSPDRLLGFGSLDITSLCLGQTILEGQAQVGVMDTWVPISMPGDEPQKEEKSYSKKVDSTKKQDMSSSATNTAGRVRVLVSYQPHGMEPQSNDIVALEAFARQNPKTASCQPVLPSLLPLRVSKRSGPWLLVEYQLQDRIHESSNDKACIRLHRNAVFVIERKNLVDETLNLALLPADVFISTPLGKSTMEFVAPLWIASTRLLMPAVLSTKLLWMAVRTTTKASLTGVHAATSAVWNEGSSSLTQREEAPPHRRNKNSGHKFV